MAEKTALREWREVFLSVSMTDAYTIWLLLRLVEEAGFEPTCLLVTPGRLRNAKVNCAT
jgi:hypothetical protein